MKDNFKSKQNFYVLKHLSLLVIVIFFYVLIQGFSIFYNEKQVFEQSINKHKKLLEKNINHSIIESSNNLNVLVSSTVDTVTTNTDYLNNMLASYTNNYSNYVFIDQNFSKIINNKGNILVYNKINKYLEELFYKKSTIYKKKSLNIIFSNYYSFSNILVARNIFDKTSDNFLGAFAVEINIPRLVKECSIEHLQNVIILDSDPKLSHNLNISNFNKEEINKIESSLDNYLKMLGSRYVKGQEISGFYTKYYDKFFALLKIPVKETSGFFVLLQYDASIIFSNILDAILRKFVEIFLLSLIYFLVFIYNTRSVFNENVLLKNDLEESNNTSRAKTNFLCFVAHEIRSPLSFIMTGSEIMKEQLMGILPSNYKSYAFGIYQSSKIIKKMLDDILDEHQIIEARFKILNSINDIDSIIDNSIILTKARYNQRDVNIETHFENKLPLIICDQQRMLQVFNNLIGNAIKYSNNACAIMIKAYLLNDDLYVDIIDQGMGISKKDLDIILSNKNPIDSLQQNERGYAPGSYGLGLVIVQILLKAQDMSIKIKSVENIGTTVQIIIPKIKLVV
ncbi:sensor histidine kinase [Rickettsia endosymbiont of Cardiosporidium cionae]|uniref:sensor histidine kinase n=1 Tax=Rickettsia endosymbiont of Cardiosporidium cionae TaxID=2777155 RepID=UPI0018930622|nr:HAMP domain-containing sensor histidine kinase [Rickettsia endosymbiont of Cardiosporidium cionae]KAF8818333.1 Adaptive-response sensory-kinase SasA [Rickettsia endosymbiont of Cardiosporidium cionae]